MLLVEPLGGGERAPGGEAEARVRLALQRGEVVEERRALLLRRLLELRDRARLAADGGDDRLGLGGGLQARLRAGVEAALVARGRARRPWARSVASTSQYGLGLEGADLLLAAGDDRQRRRLHAARARPRRRTTSAGGSSPRASRSCRRSSRPRSATAPPPRAARSPSRGRRSPSAARIAAVVIEDSHSRSTGLLRAGLLERPGEDQLALAAGVAGVDDPVDVVALEQLGDDAHLLLRALVAHDELEARPGTIGRSAMRHFLYLASYSSGSASWTRWPTAHVMTWSSDSR